MHKQDEICVYQVSRKKLLCRIPNLRLRGVVSLEELRTVPIISLVLKRSVPRQRPQSKKC